MATLTKPGRKPSPFTNVQRVTVRFHADLDPDGDIVVGTLIDRLRREGLSVAARQGSTGATLRVAPAGYAFSASARSRGLRVSNPETSALVRELAERLGTTPDEVIRTAIGNLSLPKKG